MILNDNATQYTMICAHKGGQILPFALIKLVNIWGSAIHKAKGKI